MKVHVWRKWERDRGRPTWTYQTWCGRAIENHHHEAGIPAPGMLEGATCKQCLRALRDVAVRELDRLSRELLETVELLGTLEYRDARRRSRRERSSRKAELEQDGGGS